jgi:hypothetical protein
MFRITLFYTSLLIAFASLSMSLYAQSEGVPVLTGIWQTRGCAPQSDLCPDLLTEKSLHPRAMGFRNAFDEIAAPKYYCGQVALPQLLSDPYNFQIEQKPDRVIFTYEQQDIVRTIWLDGHGHAKPNIYEFFWHGYSTGRYEGSHLVVETTKFTFDPSGLDKGRHGQGHLPSSTQKRVVERYWREGDRLRADVVTEDPIFLLEPIRRGYQWQWTEEPLALPYSCDLENAIPPLENFPTKYPVDRSTKERD